ncbi:hypothetical protein H8959_008872 [Pygathrix nigripes]
MKITAHGSLLLPAQASASSWSSQQLCVCSGDTLRKLSPKRTDGISSQHSSRAALRIKFTFTESEPDDQPTRKEVARSNVALFSLKSNWKAIQAGAALASKVGALRGGRGRGGRRGGDVTPNGDKAPPTGSERGRCPARSGCPARGHSEPGGQEEGDMPQTVVLPGPAPWGFRLSGGIDFNQPLVITRVGVGVLAFAARWGLRRRPGGRGGCPGAEGGQKARAPSSRGGGNSAKWLRSGSEIDKVRSKGVPSSGSAATFRGEPLGSGKARLPDSSASSPLRIKCLYVITEIKHTPSPFRNK